MKAAVALTITGILAGLAVDYLAGSVVAAALVAAAVASYRAGSLASALARGLAAGLAWLAIAYLVAAAAYPGSLAMVELTARIAGIPTAAAYAVEFTLAAAAAASAAALVHYTLPSRGGEG